MAKNTVKLDRLVIRILSHLQRDSRLAVADLASEVGLSTSACWRRVKQLEDAGVIEQRVTILNEQSLGVDFIVIAAVKLTVPHTDTMRDFEKTILSWPEVLDCYTITGDADYILKIVTTDIHAYDDFLRSKLLALGSVSEVRSRIVVAKVKSSTVLPLELVQTS